MGRRLLVATLIVGAISSYLLLFSNSHALQAVMVGATFALGCVTVALLFKENRQPHY